VTEKNHDPELEAFLTQNYARLLRYTRSKVPESEAYDLVQESLEVIVKKRGEIIQLERFMFGVLCNKIKQYYERCARQAGIVGFIWNEQALSVESLSTSLSIRVARHNDLEFAMQKLTVRQYSAFELRYVEGLDEQATAEALQISRATLKRDVTEARTKLASVLGDVDDDVELSRIVRAYVCS